MNPIATRVSEKPRWSLQYILINFVAVFLSFFLHEFAHWLTGEFLGEEMAMNLNAAYPIGDVYQEEWHRMPITIAGPAFTLLQAIVVFYLMKSSRNIQLYPFLLTPLVMRTLAGVMNFINPNDEGRISISLGLGLFTLPILICAILFYLVLKTSIAYRISFKFNALNVILIIALCSVLILSNQYFVS